MSFKVCTYNMGTNMADYQLFRRWEIGEEAFEAEGVNYDRKSHDAAYEQAQNQMAEKLAAEPVDVYLLQEVSDKERPLIKKLTEMGYSIAYNDKNDTAIALAPGRFRVFREEYLHEREGKRPGCDIATIITAQDNTTQKTVIFVSTHIAGFDLTIDKNAMAEQATTGDAYFRRLMTKLDEIEQESAYDMTIIGGDINASPEIYNDRFNPVNERGFQTHRTGSPTAVNGNDDKYREREIDYFFSKSLPSWFDNLISAISAIFIGGIVTSIETSSEDITTLRGQPSDHIPVFLSFKSEEQQSLISKVWAVIFG